MLHVFTNSNPAPDEVINFYQQAFTELFGAVIHVLDDKLTFFSKRNLVGQIKAALKETDIIIILNTEWLNILPKNLAVANIFFVVTDQQQPYKILKNKQKPWLNLALIVPSEYCRQICLGQGFSETALHLIPPPLLSAIAFQPNNQPTTFVLGVKTALKEGQGLESVLQALHNLREILPHIKLIIIGDGPDKRKFLWLIDHLQLKNKVQIVSGFTSYHKFFANLSILILPENQPRIFDEQILYAFAYQLPIIATALGGNQSLIQNGQNGLLFAPNNYHTLEQHIINLCNHPDWLQHYRQVGPQTINNLYSINAFVKACKQIFL